MKIADAVGMYVRVSRDEGQIQFRAIGELVAPADDGLYLVRVSEDPRGHGGNFVGFDGKAVMDVYKNGSGIIEIAIK